MSQVQEFQIHHEPILELKTSAQSLNLILPLLLLHEAHSKYYGHHYY